jgi:YVTN family beta-propeller protein
MGITAPTAINGQLYVYVALSKVGKVAVLSASTNSVIENITVGANPEGIYSVPDFTTSFVESGLASGLTWSVTYNSIKSSSTSAAIGITVPEGTYYFSIPNVQSNLVCNHQLGVGTQYYYAPSPVSGSAVGGSTENVTFTIYSKTVSC